MKVLEIAIAQIGRGVESVYKRKASKLRWLIDFEKQTTQNAYLFYDDEYATFEHPEKMGDNEEPVKLSELFVQRAKKEIKDYKDTACVMIEMDFATNTISDHTVVYITTGGERKKYPHGK